MEWYRNTQKDDGSEEDIEDVITTANSTQQVEEEEEEIEIELVNSNTEEEEEEDAEIYNLLKDETSADIETEIYSLLETGQHAVIMNKFGSCTEEIKAAILAYCVVYSNNDPDQLYDTLRHIDIEQTIAAPTTEEGEVFVTEVGLPAPMSNVEPLIDQDVLQTAQQYYCGQITFGMTDGNDRTNRTDVINITEPQSEESQPPFGYMDSQGFPRSDTDSNSFNWSAQVSQASQPQTGFDNTSVNSSPAIKTKSLSLRESLNNSVSFGFANNASQLRIDIPPNMIRPNMPHTPPPQSILLPDQIPVPHGPLTPPPQWDRDLYDTRKEELKEKHRQEIAALNEQHENEIIDELRQLKSTTSNLYNQQLQTLLQQQEQELIQECDILNIDRNYVNTLQQQEQELIQKCNIPNIDRNDFSTMYSPDPNLTENQNNQLQQLVIKHIKQQIELKYTELDTTVKIKQRIQRRHTQELNDLQTKQKQELEEIRQFGQQWKSERERDRDRDRDRNRITDNRADRDRNRH